MMDCLTLRVERKALQMRGHSGCVSITDRQSFLSWCSIASMSPSLSGAVGAEARRRGRRAERSKGRRRGRAACSSAWVKSW